MTYDEDTVRHAIAKGAADAGVPPHEAIKMLDTLLADAHARGLEEAAEVAAEVAADTAIDLYIGGRSRLEIHGEILRRIRGRAEATKKGGP